MLAPDISWSTAMNLKTCMALTVLFALGACATSPTDKPDFAARNRPLEERCVRQHPGTSRSAPGQTAADIQAEARAAAARGELDKACDAL